MKFNFYNLCFILFLLTSCKTIDVSVIEDTANHEMLNPLELKLHSEAALIRVDLVRNIETITRDRTMLDVKGIWGETVTEKVESVYKPIGIYIGNGIFVDLNKNLCLDVFDFFGLKNTENVKMVRKSYGIFPEKIEYKKQGNVITVQEQYLFKKNIRIISNEKEVIIENGSPKIKSIIEFEQDSLSFDAFGALKKESIKKTGQDSFELSTFKKNQVFKMINADTVNCDKFISINKQEKKILIKFYNSFGVDETYTFIKIKNGCVFFDKNNHGVEIKKQGDSIIVSEDSVPMYEYLLILM